MVSSSPGLMRIDASVGLLALTGELPDAEFPRSAHAKRSRKPIEAVSASHAERSTLTEGGGGGPLIGAVDAGRGGCQRRRNETERN